MKDGDRGEIFSLVGWLVWLVGWLVKKVKEKSCCFDRLIDCLVDRFDRLSCKIVPLLSLVFVLVLVLVLVLVIVLVFHPSFSCVDV